MNAAIWLTISARQRRGSAVSLISIPSLARRTTFGGVGPSSFAMRLRPVSPASGRCRPRLAGIFDLLRHVPTVGDDTPAAAPCS
jgi:hypothetical protein